MTSSASTSAGTVSVLTSTGPSRPVYVHGKWEAGQKAGKYFIVWNNDGSLRELGSFVVAPGYKGTFAAPLALPSGEYRLGTVGVPSGIGVCAGKHDGQGPDDWQVGTPDFELTNSLAVMGTF